MTPFSKFRAFWVYLLIVAGLTPSMGCYKPRYLQKSEATEVSHRWRVQAIEPSLLTEDERQIFTILGPPAYIRFFRRLSPERERVYAWVYTEPVRVVCFVDGKHLPYVLVDENLSSLNYQERRWRLYGSIGAAAAAGVGLLTYYLIGRK